MSEEAEAYGKDEAVETTPETAFVGSVDHTFDGVKLEPYTITRQWAADAMNLRYGHVDEAGMARYLEERIYPGAESDVAIVIWLCSITDDARIDRARRDPLKAVKEAGEWAEAHGIASSRSDKFWTAYAIFLTMMSELRVSTGEPEKKTETTGQPTPT